MKRARLLATILILAMALTGMVIPVSVAAESAIVAWDGTSTEAPEGSGTAAAPYLVSNAAQLAWIAEQSVAGSSYSKYVTLEADIDLGGKAWNPIGGSDGSGSFRGTFDGKGHTVYNLTVSGLERSGLFGSLINATVTDVKFVNAQIATTATEKGFGGALAGYTQGSTISDIFVDATSSIIGYNAGGLIGRTWSSMSNISYCVNNASVSTDGANAGEAAGGIVGLAGTVNITYCINNGAVQNGAATGEQMVGGIAGRFGATTAGTISYCLNTGSVSSSHTAGCIAGKSMLAGCSYVNCVSTVPLAKGNKDYSGALVGRFTSAATATDCYIITSSTYDVTGKNATSAAYLTQNNVADAKTDAELTALNAAAKAIRDEVMPEEPEEPEQPEQPEQPELIAWDGTSTEAPEGLGTAASPYLVSTAAQLAWIAEQSVAGSSYSKYVTLEADIDLGGKAWNPIGGSTGSSSFRGTFDGKGHTVYNLKVSGLERSGLFGSLINATATNVKFVNAQITTTATDKGFGGALAGYVHGSTVSKITVDKTSSIIGYNAGGVAGRTWSSMSNISYCVNYATVSTDGAVSGECAGGIAGLAGVVNITYCINFGTIGTGGKNNEMVGGISGRFGATTAGTVSYCLNVGPVSSSHTAGGISGSNFLAGCAFENCVSTVPVTAGNKDYSGSLVGRFSAAGTATDCYVVTSETYGVTGKNQTSAANATLTNVVDAKTDAELTALSAAAQAIRDKVIPAEIVIAGAQTNVHAETGKFDVRFLATVNTIGVRSYGFVISASWTEGETPHSVSKTYSDLTTVFRSINAAGETVAADDGFWFAPATLTGIPADLTVEFTVTPFLILADGNQQNGAPATFRISASE